MSMQDRTGAEDRSIDIRDVSVKTFVGSGEDYYVPVFERIQRSEMPRWHGNVWGLVVPWIWAAYRGVWLMFWLSLAIDMLAVVCLMQVVKFTPLLAQAQENAAENVTLVARYSRWINTFGSVGFAILVLGRAWMGSSANRWYYGQYSRWRIDDRVPSGTEIRRVGLGLMIMLIIAPLTTYRATQQRLDERACLNQLRTLESVDAMMATYGVSETAELRARFQVELDRLVAEKAALDAVENRNAEQDSRRSSLRRDIRLSERQVQTLDQFSSIGVRERFDCWFIDDFPTIARLDPPEDAVYRRVPDEAAIGAGEEGATKVVKIVRDPVEGRKVNFFTYSAEKIDISINYLRANFATAFDAITNVLRQSLIRVEIAFMLTPWIVVAFLFLALSWAFAGTGTTIFVGASLAFLAVFELWQVAMQTMALVVVSTALCGLVGLPVGVWMAKNKVARWITEPILDVMQTIPSLSYLVPAVAFFGISQPPAVLATVVFAMPPMIKLTALGILQVPDSTKEAALAFGASERQLLRKVELPMAIPSIMAGLNQTIMLALSMATISAFIGAEGLGAIVTASLGDAQAGKGLLAGIAIALVAMVIDRILKGIRNSFSLI